MIRWLKVEIAYSVTLEVEEIHVLFENHVFSYANIHDEITCVGYFK